MQMGEEPPGQLSAGEEGEAEQAAKALQRGPQCVTLDKTFASLSSYNVLVLCAKPASSCAQGVGSHQNLQNSMADSSPAGLICLPG